MNNEMEVMELTPNEGLSFAIVEGVNDFGFRLHTHNYCEMGFVVSGSATHMFNGAEYSMGKGDFFTVKGRQYHGYKDCRKLRLFIISFEYKWLNKLSSEIRNLSGFKALFAGGESLGDYLCKKFEDEKYKFILTLLNSILKEVSLSEEGYVSLCELYLSQLIIFLSREYRMDKPRDSYNSARLTDTMKYIKENLSEQMTNHQLADVAHMSLRHFIRIFKHIYNDTPTNFILKLRLEKARDLLEDGTYNVYEISNICGFSHSNYFSKIFRKAYGVTPRDYRKTNAKNNLID